MDPATIVMGVEALSAIATTLSQYTAGIITAEQAHQNYIDACKNVAGAIAAFEAAKQPSETSVS